LKFENLIMSAKTNLGKTTREWVSRAEALKPARERVVNDLSMVTTIIVVISIDRRGCLYNSPQASKRPLSLIMVTYGGGAFAVFLSRWESSRVASRLTVSLHSRRRSQRHRH
jgi:hypothetical protein